MRRSLLCSTVVAGLFVAGIAVGAEEGSGTGTQRGTSTYESGTTGSAPGRGTPERGSGQTTETGTMHHAGSQTRSAHGSQTAMTGQHQMTGTVRDIDKAQGRVTLDADGQQLQLHFPQQALANINRGDRVTVSLGIRQASGTEGRGASEREGTTGSRGANTGAGGSGAPGRLGPEGAGGGQGGSMGEGATGTMNR